MKDKINIIVVFSSKVIVAIMGMLLLSLETKFITPEALGEYSLLSGVINAGICLLVSWVGSSALRYFDLNVNKLDVFNSTVFFEGVVSIAVLLVLIILIGITAPELCIIKYFPEVIGLIISRGIFEIYEKVLRAGTNFKVYSFLTVIQYFVDVMIFYLLAEKCNDNISVIFIALIISLVIFDFIAFLITKSYRGVSFNNVSFNMNRKFLNYGIPMIGTWAISWLLNYVDRYMIRFFYSTYEVGVYTTAYTVSQSAVGLFSTSITLTFFPILIKKWNSFGHKAVTDYVNKILEYYFMFMFPAVVGLGMISEYLYGTLVDISYVQGARVIALTAIGFFFMGANDILFKMWQLEEKPRRVLGLITLSFILNVVMNFVCLPIFGFEAAAYTTIFSYVISFVIALSWIKKSFRVKFDIIRIGKTLIAVFIMCLFVRGLRQMMTNLLGIIGVVSISGGAYLLIQFSLGNLKKEQEFILNAIKKWKG